MSGRKTITIDDRDSQIHYTGGAWFLDDWNAPAVNQAGNFTFSNDVGAQFAFSLPETAVSFTYFGLPRCCGGFYEICIDCVGSDLNWQNVDAVVTSDDGKQPPIPLFNKDFGTAGSHTIIVRNQADQRFGGTSQITIDRIEVVVDPNAPSSTPPATTTTSSPPATTNQPAPSPTSQQQGTTTGNPSTSTSQSTQSGGSISTSASASGSISSTSTNSNTTSPGGTSASENVPSASADSKDSSNNTTIASANLSTKSTPVGAIAGGVVGSVAVIVGVVLLFLWLRRRKSGNEQYSAVPFTTAPVGSGSIDGYRDDLRPGSQDQTVQTSQSGQPYSQGYLQGHPQNRKNVAGLSGSQMMQRVPGQLSAGAQYTVGQQHNTASSSNEPAASESGYTTSYTQSTSTRSLMSPPLSTQPSAPTHSPSASVSLSNSSRLPTSGPAASENGMLVQEVDAGLIMDSNITGLGDTSLPPGYDQLFGSERR